MTTAKSDILIIGGGISGLICARELSRDHSVILLEALDRLGGRIHTEYPADIGVPIEHGAEFIHGHLPQTLALLKEADLHADPAGGRMYRKGSDGWSTTEEGIEHWDLLIKKMGEVDQDLPFSQFLEQAFPGPGFELLRAQASSYAGGFDLADVERVSTRLLHREWNGEDPDNFRVREGYGALVAFLARECMAKGCRIITGDAVTVVNWEPGSVSVVSSAGKQYNGHQLLVTIPIAVLQKTDDASSHSVPAVIRFTPAIPGYIGAARQIGMGKVTKAVLVFEEPFWQSDADFFLSQEAFPTWWTHAPSTYPVLTGWAGGATSAALTDLSEEQLQAAAIGSLSRIFGLPDKHITDKLIYSSITRWSAHPWSLGGYSYPMPGTPDAIMQLNTPIADTIFFGGEALYMDHSPGTVEAAILQARQVIAQMRH